MQYFVVMIDYGRRGREAIVDPEITRREVIERVASGEYRNICFIYEIADVAVEDVTEEILAEATVPEIPITGAELQATQFDHARDLSMMSRREQCAPADSKASGACQNDMLQESHTHEDCAAVLFTFARVDEGYSRSELSWRGVESALFRCEGDPSCQPTSSITKSRPLRSSAQVA
jgi:hypothetical protein